MPDEFGFSIDQSVWSTGQDLAANARGMARSSRIAARFTRTHSETPLVVLEGGPFNGMEATPEQLLALAHTLARIATHSAERPCKGRRFLPQTRTYEVA